LTKSVVSGHSFSYVTDFCRQNVLRDWTWNDSKVNDSKSEYEICYYFCIQIIISNHVRHFHIDRSTFIKNKTKNKKKP